MKIPKDIVAYLIIIAGLILLIMHISELDFDNLKKGPFSGIVSNILLILAMIITIRKDKAKKEKEN
ncbi:hypothetical protein [Winogradskyella sp. 4-2091]|uniref:hypothetical protein n=1 Tax=Winogradskyella sp. 4-2091 TaxID=3381659 RepID=UPI00389202EC